MRRIETVFLAFAIALLFFSGQAKAERPTTDNVYQYIGGLGQIAFSKAGGAFLPINVLSGLKNGQVSPIMQFVLVNHLLTSCTKKVIAAVPYRRDPFKVANQKFTTGYCKIRKCFEQGMLLGQISQMSNNPKYGGSSDDQDRQSAQMLGLALAQSFQKDSCSGTSSQDSGIDPSLVSIFQ